MNTVVSFIGNFWLRKVTYITIYHIFGRFSMKWKKIIPWKLLKNMWTLFFSLSLISWLFFIIQEKNLVYAPKRICVFFKFIYELPMSIRAILFQAHLQPYFTSFSANKNEIKKFISKLLSGGGFLLGLKICGGLLELLLQLDTVGLHVNKSFPQRWLENK